MYHLSVKKEKPKKNLRIITISLGYWYYFFFLHPNGARVYVWVFLMLISFFSSFPCKWVLILDQCSCVNFFNRLLIEILYFSSLFLSFLFLFFAPYNHCPIEISCFFLALYPSNYNFRDVVPSWSQYFVLLYFLQRIIFMNYLYHFRFS